jgi:hypothetical protein
LCVKKYTSPNTTACVNATVVLEPPGGKDKTIPGVRIKKRIAT